MEERKNPRSSDSASSDGAEAPSEAEKVVNHIANSEGSFIDGILEETLKALRRAEKQSDRKAASKAVGGFGEGLFCHLQGKIARLCLNDDVYSSALKQIGLFVKGKVLEVWGKVSDGQIPPGCLELLDERLTFIRRQAEPARLELFHSEVGLVIQPHQELVATLDFSDQSNSGIQLVDKTPVDREQLKAALAGWEEVKDKVTQAAGLDLPERRRVTGQGDPEPAKDRAGLTPANSREPTGDPHEPVHDSGRRDSDRFREVTKRFSSSVESLIAAARVRAYMAEKGVGQTELATRAGMTDRTLRNFLKTGRLRRQNFDDLAAAIGISKEQLLKPT